jgi:hypothetical protein
MLVLFIIIEFNHSENYMQTPLELQLVSVHITCPLVSIAHALFDCNLISNFEFCGFLMTGIRSVVSIY